MRFAAGVEALARRAAPNLARDRSRANAPWVGGRIAARSPAPALAAPGPGDWEQVCETLARLYTRGATIDWPGFEHDFSCRPVALPTYPWNGERYWLDPPADELGAGGEEQAARFLGRRLRVRSLPARVWEAEAGVAALPFLADHRIYSTVVVPGACHLARILAAAAEEGLAGAWEILDVAFPRALAFAGEESVPVQLSLGADGSWEVASRVGPSDEQEVWQIHATGCLRGGAGEQAATGWDEDERPRIQARCAEAASGEDFYGLLDAHDIVLGRSFRWIEQLWRRDGEALARFREPIPADREAGSPLPTGLVDACFQIFAAVFPQASLAEGAWVPAGIESFLYRPDAGMPAWCHAVHSSGEGGALRGDVWMFDRTGRSVVEGRGLQMLHARREALLAALEGERQEEWRVELAWRRLAAPAEALRGGLRLLLADRGGVATALAARLEAAGQHCRLLDPVPLERTREALACALAATQAAGPVYEVVHLWSLDVPTPEILAREPKALGAAQELTCGTILHLVQALAAMAAPPRLTLVTCGACEVGAEQALSPAQAPLWGLARSLAAEHPELSCALHRPRSGARRRRPPPRTCWRSWPASMARTRSPGAPANASPPGWCGRSLPPSPTRSASTSLCGASSPTSRWCPRRVGRPGRARSRSRSRPRRSTSATCSTRWAVSRRRRRARRRVRRPRSTAVGAGVDGLAVGDEVVAGFAPGSFASHVVSAGRPGTAAARTSRPPRRRPPCPSPSSRPLYGLDHLARVAARRAGADPRRAPAASGWPPCSWRAGRGRGDLRHRRQPRQARRSCAALGVAARLTRARSTSPTRSGGRPAGAGVDVVLNSLAGDFIPQPASWRRRALPGDRQARHLDAAQVAERRARTAAYFPFDLGDLLRDDAERPRRRCCTELIADRRRAAARAAAGAGVPGGGRRRRLPLHGPGPPLGKVVRRPTGAAADSAAIAIRADGTYLITGGLGGLGLLVAGCLVERGCRHLVLVGRRAPSADGRGVARSAWTAAGAACSSPRPTSPSADDRRRACWPRSTRRGRPCAGSSTPPVSLDDGVLRQQDAGRASPACWRPRSPAAWNLHSADAADLPLDFFVLFSSAAARPRLARPGQLRGGQRLPRRPRLVAAAAGTAGDSSTGAPGRRRDGRRGRRPRPLGEARPPRLGAEEGLAIFAELLRSAPARVGVLPVDWARFAAAWRPGEEPSLTRELTRVATRAAGFHGGAPAPAAAGSGLAARLAALAPAERASQLARLVAEQAARVLSLPNSRRIDPQQPLQELGLDSLMAVELRNGLNRLLGCALPATLIFKYPTINALAAFLDRELVGTEVSAGPALFGTDDSSRIEQKAIASLTPDQTLALLAEELELLTVDIQE